MDPFAGRLVVFHMRQVGGLIVNILMIGGKQPGPKSGGQHESTWRHEGRLPTLDA